MKVTSPDFGRVTVHTAYGRETIATQITLENIQLGSALAAHVPAMEQKLGQDHGLRASVTIDTQTQAGAEQGRQHPSDTPPTPPGRRSPAIASAIRDGTPGPVVMTSTPRSSTSSTTRLDIRI